MSCCSTSGVLKCVFYLDYKQSRKQNQRASAQFLDSRKVYRGTITPPFWRRRGGVFICTAPFPLSHVSYLHVPIFALPYHVYDVFHTDRTHLIFTDHLRPGQHVSQLTRAGPGVNTPLRFFADSRKTAARSAAVFGTAVHTSFPHTL